MCLRQTKATQYLCGCLRDGVAGFLPPAGFQTGWGGCLPPPVTPSSTPTGCEIMLPRSWIENQKYESRWFLLAQTAPWKDAKLLYVGRVSLVPAIKVPVRLILTLIPPLLTLASVPLNKLLFKRWKWGQSFWTRELKARWGRGSQGQRMCVKRMKSNQTVQRGGQQLFLSHKEGRPSLDLTSHSRHSCSHEGACYHPRQPTFSFC